MHVRVELLNDHGWTSDRGAIKRLPTPTVDDNGKCNVKEIRQNDLAFRMNASSREILQEVLTGSLIMELNRRRCRIRGEDAPECRGFLDKVDLRLGAMKQLTQEREIDRERETIRKVPTAQCISKYKELKVHMHENA